MASTGYRKFHTRTVLVVSVLVLSRGGIVLTEDRAKAAQEPVVQKHLSQSLIASAWEYQPTSSIAKVLVAQYDFDRDDSLQKYLGNGQVLTDPDYVPQDLEPILSNFTANDSQRFSLRQEAGVQFADLAWHFWNEFKGAKLTITSAYRSGSFQESLLKNGCSRARCAKVGSSEHQLGLALDLGVITKGGKYVALNKGNIYYQWMVDHAADWGFHNSYQKGIEVDGQMEEGRHRRYLGTDLAKKLLEQQVSFGEYIKTTTSQEVVQNVPVL